MKTGAEFARSLARRHKMNAEAATATERRLWNQTKCLSRGSWGQSDVASSGGHQAVLPTQLVRDVYKPRPSSQPWPGLGSGQGAPFLLKLCLGLVCRFAIHHDKCKDQLRFDPCTPEAYGG